MTTDGPFSLPVPTEQGPPPLLMAVDLAAVYSAACVVDAKGDILEQVDSWQVSEDQFLHSLVGPFIDPLRSAPEAMIVEDLPIRLPMRSLVKRVCRIQGRLIELMSQVGMLDRLWFVQPSEWRRTFAGLESGTGPNAVVEVALRLGIRVPDLASRCTQTGDKGKARKVFTDHCAAYLIALWATHTYHRSGSFDTGTTSRYDTVSTDGT
jgi:hypothetical protein